MKSILLFVTALGVSYGQSGGVISTVAGNGTLSFSGDGGPAILATMALPTSVAADRAGNVYIVDRSNNRVRKVAADGTMSTFAGIGRGGFGGDGGPAANAMLLLPIDVAVDSSGNVYIADQGNEAIRKVNSSGIISTVAGGPQGRNGTSGTFSAGDSVALDAAGNIYSSGAAGITKIDTAGKMSLIAGGAVGFSGDGGPAKNAALDQPSGIAFDSAGNLYFADKLNRRVRKIDTAGIITTVAGSASVTFSGDGGPAINAGFGRTAAPFQGVAVDRQGNLYIADPADNRVRVVNTSGMITTFAGDGLLGLGTMGDGDAPTKASLLQPGGVFVDANGNVFIADTNHNKIRKVIPGSVAAPGSPIIAASGVVNGASLATGIGANSWITILGTNLAPRTDDWSNSVVNGRLPTSLDGVSVTVGGMPAYVYYISPSQINALAPDVTSGTVAVTVTTPNGTSAAVNATAALYAPAFFNWPGNQAVATRSDYSFVARAGTFPSLATTAAKPGEVIVLWGTGFGPTSPAPAPGTATPSTAVYSTVTPPTVTLSGAPVQVLGAALTPGSAGLFQIAVQLPQVAEGTYTIQASIGGVQSPASTMLAICSTASCGLPKK